MSNGSRGLVLLVWALQSLSDDEAFGMELIFSADGYLSMSKSVLRTTPIHGFYIG